MSQIHPATLPLALNRSHEPQDGARLPLALLRPLGHQQDGDGGGPIAPPPKSRTVAVDWVFAQHPVSNRSSCIRHSVGADALLAMLAGVDTVGVDIARCHGAAVSTVYQLWHEAVGSNLQSRFRSTCQPLAISTARYLRVDNRQHAGLSLSLHGCRAAVVDAARLLANCQQHQYGAAWRAGLPTPAQGRATDIGHCQTQITTPARTVPGDFYPLPIPEPPPPPRQRPCGPLPPASRLPLRLVRRHIAHHPAMLPLPLSCAHRDSMPILKAYVMINHISASADGQTLQPLRLQIRTDTAAFCWQGSITLYPEDFARLQMDSRAHGQEMAITLNINGEAFVFLAEDYSDNRAFGRRTYTVSGRSVTARLGADYARTRSGVVSGDRYARQIATEQLDLLPYSIAAWAIPDWRVPGGSYSISDSTPIGVLIDIAHAAGGFVESDPAQAQLSLRPRWSKPAWQLAETVPDVTVPDSVMVSVSGQKRINPRYNSVHVWADHLAGKAADVYRQAEDRSARAPALVHPLYTDAPVMMAAGTAALSDSGIHKIETVQLPISPEHALPRAKLGQLWQFNEPSGHWRGVVTGVSIEADCQSDGAVTLWQHVTVDRYLDQ